MFAVPIDFGIQAVKVRTKIDKSGKVKRSCRVILAHEFDEELAGALGKKARGLLRALEEQEIESAVVPIDGLAASGEFTVATDRKQSVRIPYLRGTKAKAKAGKNEDDPPMVRLEFEFAYQTDAWAFFGEHCSSIASVVLTQTQLLLVGDDATN